MRHSEIIRKGYYLFSVLLISVFYLSGVSFSEEYKESEKTRYMGNEGGVANIQQPLTQDEDDDGKSIFIRLGSMHFDPLKRVPVQKAGLNYLRSYEKGEIGYYIVQFDGPIENSWKEALKVTDVDIFDYIQEFAFIIRMNSTKEQDVRALPHVRWLGIYQPLYKISQSALDKRYTKAEDTAEDEISNESFHVSVFPGEDLERIKSEITALGGMVMDEVTTKWKTTLKVQIPANRITDLPSISGIKWIEPAPKWKLYNNVSTDIMNARNSRDTYGLYGEGQTVGVCDSGFDQGLSSPASLHDDFEDGSGGARVTTIFDLVGDGADDVNSGHGTHVAGSVLGNGYMSGSDPSSNTFPSTSFAGLAPKANLVFQASENNATGSLSGLPADLNTLFSQSDGAGADLHTNSWGGRLGSAYTSNSEDVDEYMWDNPDFLILFAAGNEGVDLDGDGVIDLYSIGSPGTAKNCLTVGASEGNRPTGSGYDMNWGDFHPYQWSTPPIYNDHVSDNTNGLAAFSSRGPVLDGRYKPDLVSPGTNILSVRSSVASETGWGVYDASYMWMGGTSMATPLTAGAAALMREYLINYAHSTNPSAALIKAALLNSAEDISPGQYGTGTTQEIPDSPVPNNVEGWGRLNLGNGLFPTSPFNILYYDEQNSLNTGEFDEYQVDVTNAGYPLKINLVWTDYPGSPVAQGGLVNDLDLQVTDPSSTIHYPDNASQKSVVSTIAYDDGSPDTNPTTNRRAMRFTPSSYPVNVESASFYFYNPNNRTSDVDVVVYDDDGASGLPGTELFRETLTYIATGWITIGITGVVINNGEFYIALEKTDSNLTFLVDDDGNPTGRSYYHDGAQWTVSAYTVYIRANIRGTDYSTNFDRVNNVVGLTLDSPAMGTYTVRVNGYNVPQGPQPYALVISGGIPGGGGTGGTLQFGSTTYSVNENGGTATITVTRTASSDGVVSVDYATSDGTASSGSDYTATSATLSWADGDSSSKTISVTIIDDTVVEGDETLNLTLSNPQGGASLGTPNTVTLTITDDDAGGGGGGSGGGSGGGCFITTATGDITTPE